MDTNEQSKTRIDDSLLEDFEEQGLRILGAWIARDILEKHQANNNGELDHKSNSNISE